MKRSAATPLGNAMASAYYAAGYELKIPSVLETFSRAKNAGKRSIRIDAPRVVNRGLPWPPLFFKNPEPAVKRNPGRPARLPLSLRIIQHAAIQFVVVYLRVSSTEQLLGQNLEDRLRVVLEFLLAKRIVVLAICWDEIEGDVPFAERPGWSTAEALLHSTGASAIVTARVDRFSRHVRMGMSKAYELTDVGKPLAFLSTDYAESLTVADMRDGQREEQMFMLLHEGAAWLWHHREKQSHRFHGFNVKREWRKRPESLRTLPYHEGEAPLPGSKWPRVRAKSGIRQRATRDVERIIASPEARLAVREAARSFNMTEYEYRDYLLSGLVHGVLGSVHSTEIEVVDSAIHERLLDCLRIAYPKSRKMSALVALNDAYGTNYLIQASDARVGVICPSCGKGMRLRTRGSVERNIPDTFACDTCKTASGVPVTAVFPMHHTWDRFPPHGQCPGCGRPSLVLVERFDLPRRQVVLECVCEDPECSVGLAMSFSLATPSGRGRYLRLLAGLRHRGELRGRHRTSVFLRHQASSGRGTDPSRAPFVVTPPDKTGGDERRRLMERPRLEHKSSWFSPRKTKYPVWYPEVRAAAQEFMRNHAAEYTTVKAFCQAHRLEYWKIRFTFNGASMPKGRPRAVLLQFPEFAVLTHANLLMARWRDQRYKATARNSTLDRVPYPRVKEEFGKWYSSVKHLHGGTIRGVAEFLGIRHSVCGLVLAGQRMPFPTLRRRLFERTGLAVFADDWSS